MAIDTRPLLQQKLSQQLVMTPQLRQAIKILQVSRAELETLVDQELMENPVLEENQDERAEGEAEVPTVDSLKGADEPEAADGKTAEADPPEASTIDQIDWQEFASNYSNDMHGVGVDGGSSGGDDDERRPTIENTLVQRADLTDHLIWQLR